MKNNSEKNCRNNSRQQILATAITLFAHQGFDKTGLRELAKTAGVNLAMVNYFFGSKNKLLTEILDIFFSQYVDIARTTLSGDDELSVKLERFILKAIKFFAENREFLIIAITDLHHEDEEIIGHKSTWARQMFKIVELEICHRLAEERNLKLSPKLIMPMLTSIMSSRFLFSPVMEQIEDNETYDMSLQRYAETITAIVLDGILGQKVLR
ncbi:MAG: hypothetical protein B6I36_08835 [Desulfobacteraceae bacterium 4572_35.1]|nr:MAG: hypothetical protein B6I36_08835 [Desulfobacteraceae bacterium 4572_35.1]